MKTLIRCLLIAYCMAVFYYTILGREAQGEAKCDLVPFSSWRTLMSVPYYGHGEYILKEIIVNMLMLFPLCIATFVIPQNLRFKLPDYIICILFGGSFSVVIEVFQYVTHTGLCETDDVIHNTLGIILGCLFVKLLQNIRCKHEGTANHL